MVSLSRRHPLLGGVILVLFLATAFAGPVPFQIGVNKPIARQQTTATTTARLSTVSGVSAHAATTVSQSPAQSAASSTAVSTSTSSVATSSTRTSTSSQTSLTTSRVSTILSSSTSAPSSSSSSSTSATSNAPATATSTSESTSIFSKSSPYFTYAIGVTVAVSIIALLLLVLLIRFLLQLFIKKPQSQPTTTNLGAGGWRYSQDSDFYSGPPPVSANTTSTSMESRHKGLESDMSERHAFLSTESVALYPAADKLDNEPTQYSNEEPESRGHMRSSSSSSGSGSQPTTPFVSRRPGSLSFLHSPPATHPAFIVHPGSDAGHLEQEQHDLEAVPEESAGASNSTGNLLLSRAGHSDPYRQQMLGSGITDLSRTASTASAYSQPSMYSFVPPVPELPAQQARPTHSELSPDVSAALSTMQRQNQSTDTIDTIRTTAPPSEECIIAPTARVLPGRAGWAGRAPSSIHGPDLYFGHRQ